MVKATLIHLPRARARFGAHPIANGGKTGWPTGLLQDDCRELSRWFVSRLDARRVVREATA